MFHTFYCFDNLLNITFFISLFIYDCHVFKTYEFAESIHTIKNVEFVKTEEKSEFVDYDSCDQSAGSVETFVKRLQKDVIDNKNNHPKAVEALQMSKNAIKSPDLNPNSPKFVPTTPFNEQPLILFKPKYFESTQEIQIQEELAGIEQKRAEIKESFETLKNNIHALKGAFGFVAKSSLEQKQKFIEDSVICHNYLETLQRTGHTLPDEVKEAIKRTKLVHFGVELF
jgi:HPt (histidine-containing phosphotransfer) domain-containing protein